MERAPERSLLDHIHAWPHSNTIRPENNLMEIEDENENQVENVHILTSTNQNYEYITEGTTIDDEVNEMDSDESELHEDFDNSDHLVVRTVKECVEEGLRLSEPLRLEVTRVVHEKIPLVEIPKSLENFRQRDLDDDTIIRRIHNLCLNVQAV